MNTTDQVRLFITNNFYVGDAGALRTEDSLLEAGIVDSTGVLEIVGFLETQFGLAVEDHEIVPENLDSIARIAAFVDRKAPVAHGAKAVAAQALAG